MGQKQEQERKLPARLIGKSEAEITAAMTEMSAAGSRVRRARRIKALIADSPPLTAAQKADLAAQLAAHPEHVDPTAAAGGDAA